MFLRNYKGAQVIPLSIDELLLNYLECFGVNAYSEQQLDDHTVHFALVLVGHFYLWVDALDKFLSDFDSDDYK